MGIMRCVMTCTPENGRLRVSIHGAHVDGCKAHRFDHLLSARILQRPCFAQGARSAHTQILGAEEARFRRAQQQANVAERWAGRAIGCSHSREQRAPHAVRRGRRGLFMKC